MIFSLVVPHEISVEATYVLNWVLGERFGLPRPVIRPSDTQVITIKTEGTKEALHVPCLGGWRSRTQGGVYSAAPAEPPQTSEGVAILFGQPGETRGGGNLNLYFDLFGTIFWALTRLEELETDMRDRHGRFTASQSYLKRHNLLFRPIVDEHVEFLWTRLKFLWPGIVRHCDAPSVRVSCDVDVPYSRSVRGGGLLVRGLAGDMMRRSPKAAINTIRNAWRVKTRGDYSLDPNNTFSWIMDQCEAQGLCASFYFIAGNHAADRRYDLTEPFLRTLLCSVAARGHQIGMHASYITYQNADATKTEFANLRSVCGDLGIRSSCWGNRQHYLRWDTKVTPEVLTEAGFTYDTSLAFSDSAGFRCGTCHSFPLWSWQARAPLPLREHPLIVMEASVLDLNCMGLGREEGAAFILSLKHTCRRYGGDFSLLWHNSYLRSDEDREIYTQILKDRG